jgi:RNA polymerase sigma-70 factor (family 1)
LDIYTTYSDEQLVLLIKESNNSAFEQLYQRYWKSLYNTAYKRLQSHEESQDIVQEVFADLWIRRTTSAIRNPSAYLHTATRFQVLKSLEKAGKNEHFIQLWGSMVQQSPSADITVREKELASMINDWLQTLPEARRKIFILHYAEDNSSGEISSLLNISPKTVRNQMAKGMQSMRIKLANFLGSFLF